MLRCSSLEDAEDVLQKLAERAVGRLQVLQRGVVQGDWESAEVLERALTVDDEVPLFMARAEEKAHAHARKQRFRPPQTHEPPQHHQTPNRPHTQQTRHTPPGRHRKPGGDSRKSGAKAQ
ncbi:hypothetical protein DIPPA_15953 [Diplonema papillatum]|nr:hypothetical protein DIPPA_15953 [Diplonema papillatum]